MMKRMLCLSLILCVLGLSGCIEVTTTVNVKKDGSGTVTETSFLSQAMQEMMKQMSAAFGQAGGASPSMIPTEEDLKKKAGQMGEGVTFVSIKEIKKPDGATGHTAAFSFKDVSKLKIAPDPDAPTGPGPAAQRDQPKGTPVTFSFVAGASPTLTVHMPKPKEDGSKAKPFEKPDAMPDSDQAMPPEQLAQMRQMFDGFRIRLLVNVEGDIVKSNASFIEKNPQTGKKSAVTLYDMNFGEMMKDEKNLKKLTAMHEIKTVEEAAKRFQDIPGSKAETQDRVDIQFK